MFTNYYNLLKISPNATDEEINTALEKSTLSNTLVEEMKMVLQNKSLKTIYDEEVKLYQDSESKQDYEISNTTLEREIKKIKVYVSSKGKSITYEEEPKKNGNTWLWIIAFIIIICLVKCISSYNRGKTLEENRQRFLHGDYTYINHPTTNITKL